jgi:hypothetical protein
MNPGERKELSSIMLDTDLVEQALNRAVVQAMIRHKRLGNPIVVWRDGKVVWIPAEEIVIPGVETDSGTSQ